MATSAETKAQLLNQVVEVEDKFNAFKDCVYTTLQHIQSIEEAATEQESRAIATFHLLISTMESLRLSDNVTRTKTACQFAFTPES